MTGVALLSVGIMIKSRVGVVAETSVLLPEVQAGGPFSSGLSGEK